MVPDDIVVLDAVPLTHVGKLDRAALPEPETRTRPYRAPRTHLEEVVARVYADALDAEQVGLDDDFFDLGGNSLVATQVVARLRDETGLQVRVPWLLETRLSRLSRRGSPRPWTERTSIPQGPRTRRRTCSSRCVRAIRGHRSSASTR